MPVSNHSGDEDRLQEGGGGGNDGHGTSTDLGSSTSELGGSRGGSGGCGGASRADGVDHCAVGGRVVRSRAGRLAGSWGRGDTRSVDGSGDRGLGDAGSGMLAGGALEAL